MTMDIPMAQLGADKEDTCDPVIRTSGSRIQKIPMMSKTLAVAFLTQIEYGQNLAGSRMLPHPLDVVSVIKSMARAYH